MSRSAVILLCATLVAPQACAEIFKCMGKNGITLYQNFPCQFDSLALAPVDVQAPRAPPAPSTSSQPSAKTQVPATPVVGPSGPVQAQPRLGMTAEEVRAIWGEPKDALQEEPGEGGRSEVWSYGDSRSVRFDHRGRVSAVQH